MAVLKYNQCGIRAIAACVPASIHRNEELIPFFGEKEVANIINSTGIKERRIAPDNVTASDLCFAAAEQLINETGINRKSIDLLIFLSQDSDYKIPATAPALQHRLHLPKSTGSFDMNLSCSGYIYALSVAFAMIRQEHISRILLLDGETFSKLVDKSDKSNVPLYGDAGTATLIEKGDFGESVFSLSSDGSGLDSLKIEAGGARNRKMDCTNGGKIPAQDKLFMDGKKVFDFSLLNVPDDINRMLKITGHTVETIDLFIMHQANRFITDYFRKRLGIPEEKVPYSLVNYGNTSSASIPLTIVTKAAELKKDNVILSGFGAGFSWATAKLSLHACKICKLIEI